MISAIAPGPIAHINTPSLTYLCTHTSLPPAAAFSLNTSISPPVSLCAASQKMASTEPNITITRGQVEQPKWPGDLVYRLIVPVMKVGSTIGGKGDVIKKLCEETRARVRLLDAPIASPHRIVTHTLSPP